MQRNPEEQFLQDIAQDRFLQPPLNPEYAAKLRWLSVSRFDYNRALKSHDLM